MRVLTLHERTLGAPAHILEARREKERVLRANIARLSLALTYCDDEKVLADLIAAEDKYRAYLGRHAN